MAVDTSCPRCEAGIEDINHLLRGYRNSIGVWKIVSRGITSSPSFNSDLDDWFIDNLHNNKMVDGNTPTYLLFASVVWFLWKWRCKRAFDVDFSIPQAP